MGSVSANKNKQNIVVFYIGCHTTLKHFYPAMRALKEQEGFDVVALLYAQSTEIDFIEKKCLEYKFTYHYLGDKIPKTQAAPQATYPLTPTRTAILTREIRSVLHKLATLPVLNTLADCVALCSDFLRTRRTLSQHRNILKVFFDKCHPALLVMNANFGINIHASLLTASVARNIPVLGYSYLHGIFKEILLFQVLTRTNGEGGLGPKISLSRLVAALFPGWIGTYAGQRALPFAPGVCLAAEWMGVMPDQPWSYLSGPLTQIAAYDEAMASILIENNGLPAERIRVTGNVAYDEAKRLLDLTRADRAQALSAFGIDPSKSLVLFSTISFSTHKLSTGDAEIAVHDEVLVKLLSLPNSSILISGRPANRNLETKYMAMCRKRGTLFFSSYNVPIEHLLSLCDIFITAASNMLLLAASLDKPSIILNYGLWKKTAGCSELTKLYHGFPHADSPETLIQSASRLLTAPSSYHGCIIRERKSLSGFGTHLDGKATDRFISLVKEMVATSHENG